MAAIALAATAAFLAAAMATAFLVARRTGRSGLIDAIWSAATGTAATALALFHSGGAPTGRQMFAAVLMAVWTLRLAGHIGARTLRHGDDPRYAHLRAEWGEKANRRLFLFLQIQALCGFALVVAVAAAAGNARPLGPLDAAAAVLALGGLIGATVADRQMERFRASVGTGRAIMDRGLWAFSRHPNYFFEWLFWCCWPLVAAGGDWWRVLIALVAPMLMYWLLRHASGVPHLEAHLKRTRPEAFAAYRQRTPEFFPRLTRQ